MAKGIRFLLLIGFTFLLVTGATLVILTRMYLPRPETAAWLSERVSRSFPVQVKIGGIEVPLRWTGLGPIVLRDLLLLAPGIRGNIARVEVPLSVKGLGSAFLHQVSFSQTRPDGSVINLRGLKLKLQFASLLKRGELKFHRIELEEPEILFQGAPLRTCGEVFALGDWLTGGWVGFQEAVQKAPIQHLTLKKGVLRLTSLRLADLTLAAQNLGSKANHLRLKGVVEASTFSLPFRAEARWEEAPFPLRLQLQLEEIPLSPFRAMAPTLDLSASQASLLLTLFVPSAREAGGLLKARATHLLLRGAREPLEPEMRALFRLDLDRGEVRIEEARLGTRGLVVGGMGGVRCQGRLQYALRLRPLQASLAPLQKKLPQLPEGVQGKVFVRKVEVLGTGSDRPPRITVVGGFEGIGPLPPVQGIRLAALNGRFHVKGGFRRLLVSTTFEGKGGGELKGKPVRVDLAGTISGDLKGGDFTLQAFRLHTEPVGEVTLKGSVKGWGERTVELKTDRLALNVNALESFVPLPKGTLTLNALEGPSLQIKFQGRKGPWELHLNVKGLSLKVQGHPLVLKEGMISLTGRRTSELAARGTVVAKTLEVDGHPVKNPRLSFQANAAGVQLEELALFAYGASVEGSGAFALSKGTPEGELHLAVKRLRPAPLLLTLQERNGLRLPFSLPSSERASSLQVSTEAVVKMNGRKLTFQVRVEPIPVVPAMALAAGLLKDLPVEFTGGAVSGEVEGVRNSDGTLLASGTLTVHTLGLRPKGKNGPPSTLSLQLPFTYSDGTLRLRGDRLSFPAKALLPPGGSLPVQAGGGQIVLSFSGEASPQEGVQVAGRVELDNLLLERWAGRPLPPVNGRVRFAFRDRVLRLPEVSFRIGGTVQVKATATLPFPPTEDLPRRFTLQIPSVKLDELHRILSSSLPLTLQGAEFSGAIGGGVEVVGEAVKGEVTLQRFGLKAGAAGVTGISGRIPLIGTLGPSRKDRFVEWPEVAGEDPKQTLRAFEALLQAFRVPPPSSPPSLTITSLNFAGLELKDLAFHLTPREGRLVIEQFTFRGFGGRGWGSGVIDPFGRSLRMAIMMEEISLRAICAQFPPIRDYLMGRVNGMIELSLPLAEPGEARGQARFWAVPSKTEPRKISRELITRLGGQYRGFLSFLWFRRDRPYDYGFLDVRLADQRLTFKRLELSHRNLLGKKDLEIKVVPPFNTIPLADLLETIQEVGERVQGVMGSGG